MRHWTRKRRGRNGKASLETTIATARATLAQRKVVTNGTALAIVDSARKLWGVTLELETVELALSVLVAFVVESVAALLFVMAEVACPRARVTAAVPTSVPTIVPPRIPASPLVAHDTQATIPPPLQSVDQCHNPVLSEALPAQQTRASGQAEAGVTTAPAILAVSDAPCDRLLDLLQERGGEVLGSLRTFGKAVGVSHTEAGRLLDELKASGTVGYETTKRGTRVWLVVMKAAA